MILGSSELRFQRRLRASAMGHKVRRKRDELLAMAIGKGLSALQVVESIFEVNFLLVVVASLVAARVKLAREYRLA